MNTLTRPAYAEAMATELSRCRMDAERAKAELERRPNPKSRRCLGETYETLAARLIEYGQLKEAVTVQTRELELMQDQLQRAGTPENRRSLADLQESRGRLYLEIGQLPRCRQDYESAAELRRTIAEETGDGTDRVRAGYSRMELAMYMAADECDPERWQQQMRQGLDEIREGIRLQDTPENRGVLYNGCGIAADCLEAVSENEAARELRMQQEDLRPSLPEETLSTDPEAFLLELGDPAGTPGRDDAFLDCIRKLHQKREAAGTSEAEREAFCTLLEDAAVYVTGVRDRLVQALSLQVLSLRREQDSRESRARQADFLRRLSDAYRLPPWEWNRPAAASLLLSMEAPDQTSAPSDRAAALALLYAGRALPVLRQLMDEGIADVRDSYAGCCETMGALALEQGRIAEAQEAYLSALPVRQELAETTDYLSCRRAMARDLHGLGRVLEQKDEPEQALTLYQKECAVLQQLVEECGSRFDRQLLCDCYDALSEVSRSIGDLRSTKNYKLRKLSIQ